MPRRRSGKKIDFTHWTGTSIARLAQSAGSVAGTMFVAGHEPETILRMRGNLLSYMDATPVPGVLLDVAAGLVLVPEGTGSTILWSPITDADAPWIWYDRFSLGYEEPVSDVVDIPGLTSYRSIIDNKAMRIVRNQEVQLVIEQATLATAGDINTVVNVRSLAGT